MTAARFHYRLRWRDGGISQSLRFRNEREVQSFLATLRKQRPGVQVVVERRTAVIGPWVSREIGGAQ